MLMLKKGITWKKACSLIGISTTTLHHIKTGQNGVTNKVLYRLEQAEMQAGLVPPRTNLHDLMAKAAVSAEQAGGTPKEQSEAFQTNVINDYAPHERLAQLEGHLAGLADEVDSLKSGLVSIEREIAEMRKILAR